MNGYVTVSNYAELQQLIDKFMTLENKFLKSFHGLDNAEYQEYFDAFIKKKIADQYNNAAVFTSADMHKVTHEMLSQMSKVV